MHDDDLMDRLLKDAMAAPPPQVSAGFDAGVMRRVRPRRLSAAGRVVMAIYVVTAVAASVWLLQDLPIASIGIAAAIGVPVAAGASVYGRRLAFGA